MIASACAGDWVVVSGAETMRESTSRSVGRQIMTVQPEPAKFPRRRKFRLWLVWHFAVAPPAPLDDQNFASVASVLLRQCLLSLNGNVAPGYAGALVPERWDDLPPEQSQQLRSSEPVCVCVCARAPARTGVALPTLERHPRTSVSYRGRMLSPTCAGPKGRRAACHA